MEYITQLINLIRLSPGTRSFKRLVHLALVMSRSISFEVTRAPLGIRRHDVFYDDKFFNKLQAEIGERTLLDPQRLHLLYQLARESAPLNGDMSEVGVFKGGSTRLIGQTMKQYAPKTSILAFDTFQGMPDQAGAKDHFQGGDFSQTSESEVKTYLADLPQIQLVTGLFEERNKEFSDRKFSFVHVDCDLYKSVMACCEFFYPRLVNRGVILFDDYAFISCPGAKAAVDEFFRDKPENPVITGTGQCFVIKQPKSKKSIKSSKK